MILRSSDKGKIWIRRKADRQIALRFVYDKKYGFAVGAGGTILNMKGDLPPFFDLKNNLIYRLHHPKR